MNRYINNYKNIYLILIKLLRISKKSFLFLSLALFITFIGIVCDFKTIEQLSYLLPNIAIGELETSINLKFFLIYFSLSTALRLFSIIIIEKNCSKIGSDLSNYICMNTFLKSKNDISEADITSRLTTEIHILINGLIVPFFLVFISFLQISNILLATIILKGYLSVLVLALLAILYILFFRINNKKLKIIDKQQNKIRRDTLETIRVLCQGSDELKTYEKTEEYLKRYSYQSISLNENDALVKILAQYPKYIIEFLGPIAIFALLNIIQFNRISFGSNNLLEVLILLGFLAQKILPAVQTLYAQLTALKSYSIILKRTYSNLKDKNWTINKKNLSLIKTMSKKKKRSLIEKIHIYNWEHEFLELKLAEPIHLDKGTITCIKGSSGIGKTIFMKSLVGLEPSFLKINLEYKNKNNKVIENQNLKELFNISYMPQKPVILTSSIRSNIELGLKNSLNKIPPISLSILNIGAYGIFKINKEINLDSKIGSNGIKLSGGQIQRIALARAFANSSELIFLDEPSSALDNESEEELLSLMKEYTNIGKSIILISHSENVQRFADNLLDFSKLIK